MLALNIITYSGIYIFAVTGTLKARHHKMDMFGGAVLAFVTAYGGGTVRDLLLGIKVNWLNDYLALLLVFLAVITVFLFNPNPRKYKRTIFITDAIGIGLFTILGIEKSLANGVNEVYAVVLGTISATFGGLIVDILCNEVPDLLKPGELYATACALGASIYVLFLNDILPFKLDLLIGAGIIMTIRIVSKLKRLTLPEV